MNEETKLTTKNKTYIWLNIALAIVAISIACLANLTPGGPPLVILAIWLNGVLWYTGINAVAQKRTISRQVELIKHAAVISTIVIIFYI